MTPTENDESATAAAAKPAQAATASSEAAPAAARHLESERLRLLPASGGPQLLDHQYDGIQEYDNPMPSWWKNIFWATIFFSIAYAGYYHTGLSGRSERDSFDAELRADEARAEATRLANPVTTEMIALVRADAARLAHGKATFGTRCVICHGSQGQGLIGPNLTDEFWIHGKGRLLDMYEVVRSGVPAKGMPTWGKQLTDSEIQEVVAFVSSLRGSHPPSPKAPQGDKVDELRD